MQEKKNEKKITQDSEKLKEKMCRDFCRYTEKGKYFEDQLEEYCDKCPLNCL